MSKKQIEVSINEVLRDEVREWRVNVYAVNGKKTHLFNKDFERGVTPGVIVKELLDTAEVSASLADFFGDEATEEAGKFFRQAAKKIVDRDMGRERG